MRSHLSKLSLGVCDDALHGGKNVCVMGILRGVSSDVNPGTPPRAGRARRTFGSHEVCVCVCRTP